MAEVKRANPWNMQKSGAKGKEEETASSPAHWSPAQAATRCDGAELSSLRALQIRGSHETGLSSPSLIALSGCGSFFPCRIRLALGAPDWIPGDRNALDRGCNTQSLSRQVMYARHLHRTYMLICLILDTPAVASRLRSGSHSADESLPLSLYGSGLVPGETAILQVGFALRRRAGQQQYAVGFSAIFLRGRTSSGAGLHSYDTMTYRVRSLAFGILVLMPFPVSSQ